MNVKVKISVDMPMEMHKEGRYYVASCPVLDVMSQGTTRKKAKENLTEAIGLFFMSCMQRGTLDKALKECGLKKIQPGSKVASPRNKVTVPLEFQAPANCLA